MLGFARSNPQGTWCDHALCRKDSNFFEDPDLEPWLRSKLADYRESGYDRGHMVR